MRKLLLLSISLLGSTFSSAQGFKLDASYQYLQSGQLDEAVKTYNFSRPFLAEKQPFLTNGLNTSISYVFKSDKNFKHGINLSYSYFPSLSENEDFSNKLNLHFINLGYVLHYENAEKWKGPYSDLIVSATSSVIFRKLNGEPFVYDETKSKAFGIGGDIKFRLGYCIKSKRRNHASPFIAVGCAPYFYSPNNEAVINQTKGLVVNNWSGLFTTQIGIAFHWGR